MTLRWLTAPALTLALCLCTLPAQAAIYRWLDAHGEVHFGDQPNAGSNAQAVTSPGLNSKAAPDSPAADVSDAEAAAVIRKHKCEQAQKNLINYQQADTLKMRGADGKQRTLTPEQQVQAIVNMQKNVESFCGEQDGADTATPESSGPAPDDTEGAPDSGDGRS